MADLGGLLAGPGQLVRRGGLVRLSVPVPEGPWRAAALLAGLARLGLDGERAVSGLGGSTVVRTPFTETLAPLAEAWVRGAARTVPDGFVLDGPPLWWWCAAAGRRDAHGYLLPLAAGEPQTWPPVGAALAAAGLAATLLGPRGSGPAYRIVGARRLARLADLVADPPAEAAGPDWPA